MASLKDRIGGLARYLRAALAAAAGLAIVYWPGRLGSDDQNQMFVVLGATIAVVALGWVFLTLDRQISDDPRYRTRPAYRDDRDDPGEPDDEDGPGA